MTRAERRKKDFAKALRKQKLAEQLYNNSSCGNEDFHWYDNLHQYSKNKIHCSCFYCSAKTKNKGHRRQLAKNYAPSHNPSASDKRKIDRMNYEE